MTELRHKLPIPLVKLVLSLSKEGGRVDSFFCFCSCLIHRRRTSAGQRCAKVFLFIERVCVHASPMRCTRSPQSNSVSERQWILM